MLLAAHPNAAKQPDGSGNLPLILACNKQAPLEVVSALLGAFPAAAEKPGTGGMLPLHVACASKAPLEVVSALLVAFPAAAEKPDTGGKLPLHLACERKAPPEVVSALLVAFPAAAEKPGMGGKLPLHLACEHNGWPEAVSVVSELLTAFKGASEARDTAGKTPLDFAVANGAAVEVVQKLLLAQPAALFKVVERDNYAPAVSALLGSKAISPAEARKHGIQAFGFARGECRRVLGEALLFDGRYELDSGRPAHASATCLVAHATDHGPPCGGGGVAAIGFSRRENSQTSTFKRKNFTILSYLCN